MTKEIFKKILIPQGILAVSYMSADEKKRLYLVMQKFGSSENFAYKRFFQDGFVQWEIDGISALKVAYLSWLVTDEKLFIEVRQVGEKSIDGEDPIPVFRYFYRIPPRPTEGQSFEERSFDINEPGDFWRFLGDIAYRQRFGDFMSDRGMKSYVTVSKRFGSDDWKEWERVGILRVVEYFVDTCQ
jgi:hypothetical protein